MRLTTLIIILSFFSCTSAKMNVFNVENKENPYHRIMVVYCGGVKEFQQLNEKSFDNLVKPFLADIDHYPLRESVNHQLKEQLEASKTVVVKSSELFGINKKISYDQFMNVVDSTRSEAILFVNLRGIKTNKFQVDGTTYFDSKGYFVNYLYDIRSEKIVWISRTELQSIFHNNLNKLIKKLSRKTFQSLSKEKFIYKRQPSSYLQ